MNEQLFLKQLRIQLRGMPDEEIEDILEDYAGYFSAARESGLSDEEAAAHLGHPFDIAQDIKTSQKKPTITHSTSNSQVKSIIVLVGVVLFNMIIVLGPVLGVIGAFFGIVFSCFVLVISPFFVIGNLILGSGHWFELFLSFLLSGIGLLLLPLLISLAKKGKYYIKQYVTWNVKLVRGEES